MAERIINVEVPAQSLKEIDGYVEAEDFITAGIIKIEVEKLIKELGRLGMVNEKLDSFDVRFIDNTHMSPNLSTRPVHVLEVVRDELGDVIEEVEAFCVMHAPIKFSDN